MYSYALEILVNFNPVAFTTGRLINLGNPAQAVIQVTAPSTSSGVTTLTFFSNYNSSSNTVGTLTLTSGTWYHIIATSTSSTASLFINGASYPVQGTIGGTANQTSADWELGRVTPSDSTLNGAANVAMVRCYSNVLTAPQVYQNLIQVVNKIPTNAYNLPANILGATNPYLRILLHFDGTNLSTTFTDGSILMINGSNTGSGGTSIVGNAAIITTPSGGTVTTPKFGTGCLGSKNGPSGTTGFFGVWFPSSLNYSFGTSNFTIEFWFLSYSTQQAGVSARIASNYTSGSYTTNCMVINCPTSSAAMILQIFNIGSCSCPAPAGGFGDTTAWHHYAFVRNGTSITGYTDGVAGTPVTSSASFDGGVAAPFILGCNPADNSGAGYGGNGFIDEFRLQIGVASYTANFTPPTGPFTN
jgi:hypothetical protein